MSESAAVIEDSPWSGVLRWQLSNPRRRNAVSPAMLDWIAARAASLAGETVIITGDARGDGFCSGFDLTELDPTAVRAPEASLVAATEAMESANATFVAAIDGHAVGAGVELACTCDFRLATESTDFRVPAGRLCVVYHAAGLARFHAVFGASASRRLLLAGQTIDAGMAHRIGALHELVGDGELEPSVRRLCADLGRQAPASLRGNRRLLRALDRASLPADLLAAHEVARREAYQSADHSEARVAMRERREPHFDGT